MNRVILRFHVIRQAYDLSICKGADGAFHTAICLKWAHLSQSISIVLSSPSTLLCLELLWGGWEYTWKILGKHALISLQHHCTENASIWTRLYVTLYSELATSVRNPLHYYCWFWHMCHVWFLHRYWLRADLCTHYLRDNQKGALYTLPEFAKYFNMAFQNTTLHTRLSVLNTVCSNSK